MYQRESTVPGAVAALLQNWYGTGTSLAPHLTYKQKPHILVNKFCSFNVEMGTYLANKNRIIVLSVTEVG
jgi:hypothetical protein